MPVITVYESKQVDPILIPSSHTCLYVRREMLPNGGYKEYSFVGPIAEVEALGERARDVDMNRLDELLSEGKTFDEALTALGK